MKNNTKETPSYYAVIPAVVRYADIPPNAKLLYGEITALCNKEGFCWASNPYFAKLYKVQSTTISAWVSKLKEFGFIEVITDGKNRKIMLREKPKVPSGKAEAYASEKAEHSNTRYNNTNNTLPAVADDSKEVFNLFKEIRPSYQVLFKRKHEWAAAKRLNEQYGLEYLGKVANLVKQSNRLPYAPVITSPAEMEEKMAKLEAFWSQRKGKLEEKNKSKFAFTDEKL